MTTATTKRPPIELAAFTGGRNDPSARLRVRQYGAALRHRGVEIREYYPRVGSAHPPSDGIARVPWLLSQLVQRYWQVKHAGGYDVALLQRQLITTVNTFESQISEPRILDVDDAIWLTCRFNSVDHLASACETIVCGNDFIAEHFIKINPRVRVIPTAVDTNTWVPLMTSEDASPPIIGWIGTHGNYKYLYEIEGALAEVLRGSDARILIVSDAPPRFVNLPSSRVIYRPWNETSEVGNVQSMSIGIMPLVDSLWARGKCGCKLLQYMACGVPAVASPVGTNVGIAAHGGALLATSPAQWAEALLHLLRDEPARTSLGKKGRTAAVRHYSTESIAQELADVIRACV